jgi:hypothetical protein
VVVIDTRYTGDHPILSTIAINTPAADVALDDWAVTIRTRQPSDLDEIAWKCQSSK